MIYLSITPAVTVICIPATSSLSPFSMIGASDHQHDNHNDFIIILIIMIVTIILIVSLLVMMVIYDDNSPMSILGYLMISD